jgi:ABC-type sulfate/molybdate transport systems ATPase subunit
MSLDAAFTAARGDFDLAIDMTVEPGRVLALLGPNGAGKSTALGVLAGTVPLESGSIRLNGRVLNDVPTEARRIGVVFQDYLLFPHLSVLENVAFGPRSAGIGRVDARARAALWLDRLGVAEFARVRPGQLSGGQAQRVALARALATEPELLLLDEPLAALDVEVRDEVRAELAGHLADWGGLTIVVTHNFEDVAALAHDVVVLERGTVTQRASLRDLVREPATPYVRRLVANWAEDD